ncbi:LmbU family transcriptional regulator [Streptomyces ziwulingensis]|uniref:Antibiotic biosynthesis protein n=1 Tax=Streptomyces ziwulingensis TaxID=1045501 RepID=A0ABP9CUS4_9ACTN
MNTTTDVNGSRATRTPRSSPLEQPRRRPPGEGASRGSGVVTTRVGLQIPSDLSFEEWEHAGSQIAGLLDSSSWWLGDWLVYGKDHYDDRYQRGIRAVGLKYQTLRNYAWVSRRFEMRRRRAKLTFQHHAEVASLPVDEQEELLSRAEVLNWTTKQLRHFIRESGETEKALDVTRRLEFPGTRVQRWCKAAEQSGIEFEKWVSLSLDDAAARALAESEEL